MYAGPDTTPKQMPAPHSAYLPFLLLIFTLAPAHSLLFFRALFVHIWLDPTPQTPCILL